MTVLARRNSLLLLFVLAVTSFAIALAANAQQASAASWQNCSLTSKQKGGQGGPSTLGPSYLYKVRVKNGPDCAGGKNLVKLFNSCRRAAPSTGDKGFCVNSAGNIKKVSGYRCTEDRYDIISTAFSSRVTCRKGDRRVYHRYKQLVD